MPDSSPSLRILTNGLIGFSNSPAILVNGLSAYHPPLVSTLNPAEVLPTSAASYSKAYVAAGIPAVTPGETPIATPVITDPTLLTGKLFPVTYSKNPSSLLRTQVDGENTCFTGSDIRLLIEVADPLGPVRWAKQLIECTTITISVHRVKDPARACGFIGAKGYSRGPRTVAGTMVLTEMGKDALFEFLEAFALRDKSKDSQIAKVDQIPPFNISLLFTNEAGYASTRRLLGVDMATDGTVYSVNDAYSERTISYLAADFTPLMPMSIQSSQAGPSASSTGSTLREKSPIDMMQPPSLTTTLPLVTYQ